MDSHPPFAVSINDATKLVGLGRTSLYAAIAAGKLTTRKSGSRTLIETAVLRQFIDELPRTVTQHSSKKIPSVGALGSFQSPEVEYQQ